MNEVVSYCDFKSWSCYLEKIEFAPSKAVNDRTRLRKHGKSRLDRDGLLLVIYILVSSHRIVLAVSGLYLKFSENFKGFYQALPRANTE